MPRRIKTIVQMGAAASTLAFALVAHGDNGFWTMPYGGACNVPGSANFCMNVVNTSSNGSVLQGWSNAGGTGVSGHSGTGAGVLGDSTSSYGVHGTTASGTAVFGDGGVNGAGVAGQSTNKVGVWAQSETNNGMETYSVYGAGIQAVTDSTNHGGVEGYAINGGGYGVYGLGQTQSAYGVYAINTFGGFALWANGEAGGTTNWLSASDARLKKDIKDLPYGIRQVLALRPVTYKFKEGDDRTRLGLIAQEVQKVLPEVVHADASEMLSLDYVSLIPVTIKAFQEQERMIQQQQERIDELRRDRMSTLSRAAPVVAVGLAPLAFVFRRRRESAH